MVQSAHIEWHGQQAQAAAQAGAVLGLTMATEHLLGEAQKLTPHEEGELERSGRSEVAADGSEGGVGFDRPYAVVQHEALHFVHPLKGQAKYLEEPFLRDEQVMLEMVAAQIRRSLQ